jgi:hypothetical protein
MMVSPAISRVTNSLVLCRNLCSTLGSSGAWRLGRRLGPVSFVRIDAAKSVPRRGSFRDADEKNVAAITRLQKRACQPRDKMLILLQI